jgi:hypothetical protein
MKDLVPFLLFLLKAFVLFLAVLYLWVIVSALKHCPHHCGEGEDAPAGMAMVLYAPVGIPAVLASIYFIWRYMRRLIP